MTRTIRWPFFIVFAFALVRLGTAPAVAQGYFDGDSWAGSATWTTNAGGTTTTGTAGPDAGVGVVCTSGPNSVSLAGEDTFGFEWTPDSNTPGILPQVNTLYGLVYENYRAQLDTIGSHVGPFVPTLSLTDGSGSQFVAQPPWLGTPFYAQAGGVYLTPLTDSNGQYTGSAPFSMSASWYDNDPPTNTGEVDLGVGDQSNMYVPWLTLVPDSNPDVSNVIDVIAWDGSTPVQLEAEATLQPGWQPMNFGSYPITVSIYDSEQNFVTSFTGSVDLDGYVSFTWNGTNSAGVVQPSGIYLYDWQLGDPTSVQFGDSNISPTFTVTAPTTSAVLLSDDGTNSTYAITYDIASTSGSSVPDTAAITVFAPDNTVVGPNFTSVSGALGQNTADITIPSPTQCGTYTFLVTVWDGGFYKSTLAGPRIALPHNQRYMRAETITFAYDNPIYPLFAAMGNRWWTALGPGGIGYQSAPNGPVDIGPRIGDMRTDLTRTVDGRRPLRTVLFTGHGSADANELLLQGNTAITTTAPKGSQSLLVPNWAIWDASPTWLQNQDCLVLQSVASNPGSPPNQPFANLDLVVLAGCSMDTPPTGTTGQLIGEFVSGGAGAVVGVGQPLQAAQYTDDWLSGLPDATSDAFDGFDTLLKTETVQQAVVNTNSQYGAWAFDNSRPGCSGYPSGPNVSEKLAPVVP